MVTWVCKAEGAIMTTTWVLRIPEADFRVNETKNEKGEAITELFIEVPEGKESAVFLGMTKQLQSAMMKTARSALPVKTVPAPTVPSVREQKMPATPIAGPGANAPTPQHKTMPVRPPMSPSAIKPKKGAPSPSFGRLQHEQRLIKERRNQTAGITAPSNKVIPNSFERLTSETAARHPQPPPVMAEESPVEELGKLFDDPANP
jgi:hypothetical protein